MSTEARFELNSVNFGDDDVTIVYMHMPGDVRASGALVATHTLSINVNHPGWSDEIDALRTAATDLLIDALEDWRTTEPVDLNDLGDPDEDTSEEGMGEG